MERRVPSKSSVSDVGFNLEWELRDFDFSDIRIIRDRFRFPPNPGENVRQNINDLGSLQKIPSFTDFGAGIICYQSHCYTRNAKPTLLLSITATTWIATTISATDINCYLLPLPQPELLHFFTATLHFCCKRHPSKTLRFGIRNSGMVLVANF